MTDVRTSSATITRLKRFAAAGLLAAIGFSGSGNFAHAAALTSTNVEPATLVAGATGTATVTFTTATTIPATGKIKITFGSGYNVSGATNGACPSMDGTFSTAVAGQVVTLTRTGGTGQTTAAESCTINAIVNPQVSGTTGTYTIQTTDASDVELDVNAAVAADTITVAALSSTNVAPGSTTVGVTNTATVSFTTTNPIPATGKIKVTFGSGFILTSIASTSATCSTMDGAFDAAVAGQVVTITRSTGTSEPAGAQTCTITLVRNPVTAGTTGTYTILTTNTSDASIDTDTAVAADTMFAASSSSNAEASSTPLTYDIAFSAPAAAAAYVAGDAITIAWSTNGGTGAVAAVNLDYSTDGGSTFTSIVTGTTNDGSYVWTAPDISAQSITIRGQATDLLTVLDTDTSDAFSIGTEAVEEETETPAEDVDTGAESTTLLPTGTFFMGESWDTVYYVDGTTRRPFLDSQTFFTYADNFDAVIEASDDYLANYTIGAPMLPKAGTVLVKVQSVNKVYALEADNTLRWITSESLASSLYGSDWADYVIDVPVTAWGHFTIGEDIDSTSDIEVDDSILETRDALNSK